MQTSRQTRNTPLPRFPPELWLRIFDLATGVAGLLDYNGEGSSDLPLSIVKQTQLKQLKKSLVEKRSLVQVCKSWHELASEYLYQSVIITRVRTLESLCSALEKSEKDTSISALRRPLGWRTKRLDVIIQDQRCEAEDYALLAIIMRHFPNLSIVTLSMPMLPFHDCWLRKLPTAVVASLAETCGSSLRAFDCSESILRPSRDDLMFLLASAPNLRSLRCPICSPSAGEKPLRNRMDMPVMPELRSIVLMSVFLHDYLPKNKEINRFPALRELTYDCIPPPFYDRDWQNFIQLSCKNVTTVYIDFCLQGESLQKELDLLTECCPSLEKLVIFIRSWAELKENLVLPPVSRLGLYCSVHKGSSTHYRDLFSALGTMTAPQLKAVRLLHHQNVEDLRKNHTSVLTEGIARLAPHSFHLEDDEGNLILS
ncbi:hypothetical protein SERLA73DRAFT_172751 [Serpula lacrymans var. lacrymans S7.3]|uniref:F-box domain-containing protein n=2 Tax=Serpula lacrymans var. lacrymans TaxID=341189 RepID=F8QGH8_SERL3|nr:uncharacterized protein SERLADRAFT_434627 [Serpula lacrymans var. lacrymans S7.9]EGN92656.1 hypothetical protein SERLA73DRAFT_172751 [Serpula lacrymans var. lacrymans S7.3]EGO28718.1 hypothetical protein SERLADRAFT_434627 [Serpula lacrymans var. lacrymans S7.9]